MAAPPADAAVPDGFADQTVFSGLDKPDGRAVQPGRTGVRRRVVATVSGDTYTDVIGQRGGGSHGYRVCDAGTTRCSTTVTVQF